MGKTTKSQQALPDKFSTPKKCVCETYGLNCAAAEGSFLFQRTKSGWEVQLGHSKPQKSPFTDKDIEFLMGKCSIKSGSTLRFAIAKDSLEAFLLEKVGGSLDDQQKLEQQIRILQSIDWGQDPTKIVSVLERVRKELIALSIKPVDVELAIQNIAADPKKAATFVTGPTNRGSGKGAIADLNAILLKWKGGAEKGNAAMKVVSPKSTPKKAAKPKTALNPQERVTDWSKEDKEQAELYISKFKDLQEELANLEKAATTKSLGGYVNWAGRLVAKTKELVSLVKHMTGQAQQATAKVRKARS